MNQLELYYKPIETSVNKYKLKLFTEIINLEDDTEFECRVLGIKIAPQFAFCWKASGEVVDYSAIYDLKDGAKIDLDIKPIEPFKEISINKERTKIEISGSIKKDEFKEEVIQRIIDTLVNNCSIAAKLHKSSKRDKDAPLKKECDESLYKIYRYFQVYSAANLNHLYRLYKEMTMKELKSNLNTLVSLDLLKAEDDDEYDIKVTELIKLNNKEEIIKAINKEIKNHER